VIKQLNVNQYKDAKGKLLKLGQKVKMVPEYFPTAPAILSRYKEKIGIIKEITPIMVVIEFDNGINRVGGHHVHNIEIKVEVLF